ncbi:Phosphorylated carbohydrates phosphatase [Caulifigura coniformis]|uniref:Phosphorylated carbohydrates phosphatase n=1 Tax=Caulifigura coniformis TaxID=2527983 RepID=A0A517SBT9_9PLAN|nr:HAD family phosphatase [Caulifigura coniformis]QDT53556.1 Phosphorylated carbohydrates phosphatase [Caulifigura coniformis]
MSPPDVEKPSPRIRAVVFDFDGLMVNTEEVFQLSGTELLRRRGKEPTPAVFRGMMGRRSHEALAFLIEVMRLDDTVEQLQTESMEIFYAMLDDILQPMPGLFELLAAIERRGLPKAVATSSERSYLENLLGRLDLLNRFDALLTAEDVTHGKPHPEIYLTAAQRLGVQPAEMLVLEDSEMGTKAGAAAGAHIISVPHEHSAHFTFHEAKGVATSLIDPMILRLVEGTPA